jgi:hypothetical protein
MLEKKICEALLTEVTSIKGETMVEFVSPDFIWIAMTWKSKS